MTKTEDQNININIPSTFLYWSSDINWSVSANVGIWEEFMYLRSVLQFIWKLYSHIEINNVVFCVT